MYKIFIGKLRSDELNAISPTKTPYDVYYKAGMRECLSDVFQWWKYLNGKNVWWTDKARIDILNAITFNGFQNKISVGKDAIQVLVEFDIRGGDNLEETTDSIVRTIFRMDPAAKYRKCNRCRNTIVLTGNESMHYSTTLYFFCLKCGASYISYKSAEISYFFRMLSPDFTTARE